MKRLVGVDYDASHDVAYISLTTIPDGAVDKTYVCTHDKAASLIRLDFDNKRRLLGIEVLDAGRGLPLAFLGATSREIEVTYDAGAQAAYLYLTKIDPGGAASMYACDPQAVDGMINLDFDRNGRLIGVELLDGYSKLPDTLIP